jgi:hypothetical protein
MYSLTRLKVRILVPLHTARTEERVEKLREQENSAIDIRDIKNLCKSSLQP